MQYIHNIKKFGKHRVVISKITNQNFRFCAMKNTVGLDKKDFAFSFLLGFPIVSNQTKRKID